MTTSSNLYALGRGAGFEVNISKEESDEATCRIS